MERFGVSMPAVTIRLERTKEDMRKGRRTGWPVSVVGRGGVISEDGTLVAVYLGAELGGAELKGGVRCTRM